MLLVFALLGCAEDLDTGSVILPETREAATDGGSWRLSYLPAPDPIPFNDLFRLEVQAESLSGEALAADLALSADATMPAHGHGMNTAPEVLSLGGGAYTVEGLLFHMEGDWELSLTLSDGSRSETALFDIECCR